MTFYVIHYSQLESSVNSIENLPPTSVESVSSAGLSSSFFGSEPMCTASKTSDKESESCTSSAKSNIIRHDSGNRTEDKASTSYESQPIQESDSGSAFDPQSIANEGMPMSSLDNITEENLDSGENSGPNRGDLVRNVDSDARALLLLSDSFLSLRMFGSGITTSGSGVEQDAMSSHILLLDTSEFNRREARRNNGRLFGDTSSRLGYRRESDFPSLFLTTGLIDGLGSRDRWLLDIRSHGRNEERRNFRSRVCVYMHTHRHY